jgi:nitrogen regulatory protein P-II 1
MHEIKAIVRPSRLDAVMEALHAIPGVPGVTMSRVHAYARPHPHDADPAPRGIEADFVKLETVIPTTLVDQVTEAIRSAAHTGGAGDGMIFVSDVKSAIRIRSGDRDLAAL